MSGGTGRLLPGRDSLAVGAAALLLTAPPARAGGAEQHPQSTGLAGQLGEPGDDDVRVERVQQGCGVRVMERRCHAADATAGRRDADTARLRTDWVSGPRLRP